jgi:hypothetical protein
MLLMAAFAAVMSVFLGLSIPSPGLVRIAVALSVAFLLTTVAASSPRLALYGVVAWLVALGLIRRLLTTFGSSGGFGDPLLLVGPVLLVALFLLAIQRGAMRNHTSLSRAVLGLTVVLALSAANPLQGGFSVGFGGLLLVVIPMLAFWVGRSLVNEREMGTLVILLGALTLTAAIYGLFQTLYGMPSWDQRWIEQSGYAALNVGGTTRAFGTSSSASEYAALLGVGIMSWRAIARQPSRLPMAVACMAVIAVALWLESGRTLIVLTVAAFWLTFAATRGISLSRALLIGVVLILLLPTIVGHLSSEQAGNSGTSALVAHQVDGLSEPLGKHSTLGIHSEEVFNGLKGAITNPVGRGVGATTIAARKFEGTSANTEADPGNAPVAAGILGLILYLLIVVYGIRASYRLAQERQTLPAIAGLGIIIVTFLQWLTGGQYAIMPLPWLFLGWIDAQTLPSKQDRMIPKRANL